MFSLPFDSINGLPERQIEETQPPVSTITSLVEGKRWQEARNAVQEEINKRAASDPIRGWATLQLARLQLREEEQADAAENYRKVAFGEVAARRQDVRDAIFGLAWIDHDNREQVKAYRAFGELADISGGENTRARCRVEQIGIIMEMARSGIGKLEEVRHAGEEFLASTPPEFRNYRSTVELMSFETYFFEGEYPKVIELGKEFIEKYPDIKRERSVALHWIALGYTYLEDYENAIVWFGRVLDMSLDPDEDYFRGLDLRQRTEGWLTWINKKLNH